MTVRIEKRGGFAGADQKLFAYCYLLTLFHHNEALCSLLGNDADKEVRAKWHPVRFGLSIGVSLRWSCSMAFTAILA